MREERERESREETEREGGSGLSRESCEFIICVNEYKLSRMT